MHARAARFTANLPVDPKFAGPRNPETQERSGVQASPQGPTRGGTLLPEREAAEVGRRYAAFHDELRPSGEMGLALVRRAATLSVRLERCVEHENASLIDRVRKAIADFVPPEGASADEVARLRAEAGTLAMFDPSQEATQARRYEAATERGFYRALKELHLLKRQAKAAEKQADDDFVQEALGSFLPGDSLDEEFDELDRELTPPPSRKPVRTVAPTDFSTFGGRVDVPITIGRPR